MTRYAALLLLLCSLALAQNPAAHILVGGGLLGKLDGFCEVVEKPSTSTPCPSDRIPLGGLYGFQQQIQDLRKPETYVIVTGNNLPKDFNARTAYGDDTFLGWLRSLKADVTALGQDDLLRTVFPAKITVKGSGQKSPPSRFTDDVQEFFHSPNPRFLASNAAIRTNRTGMHKTWVGGYELMIAADNSIPWTTNKLNFSVPDIHRETITARLETRGEPVFADKCIDLIGGSGSIPVTLLPGLTYTLTIVDLPQTVKFTFQVDQALTPWENSGSLAGLPVASLAHDKASPLLVASVIDPAVLDVLDPGTWRDKNGEDARSLLLYPPTDVTKYLLAAAGKTTAIPVLLTDLGDALAAQVASSSAAWRVISFSPESHLLGCETGLKGCGKGRASGYNSGTLAVIDSASPRSRIWTRPEWIGETLIEISAVPSSEGWSISAVTPHEVAGGRSPADSKQPVQIGGKSYAPPPETRIMIKPPRKANVPVWWRNRHDVAVVLMDAMRKKLTTDLAIVDERVIDPEKLDELSDMADQTKITDIGSAELLEILWRHDPYTVIKVTGKDLAAALQKLAKLPSDDDGAAICVRGLGGAQFQQPCGLPETVKTNVLEVNGRFYNPDLYYSIALPQSLARSAGLAYHRKNMVNVFNTVLDYLIALSDGGWDNIVHVKPDSSTCKNQSNPAAPKTSGIAEPARAMAGASALLPSAQTFAGSGAAAAKPPAPLVWPNRLDKKLLSLFFLPPASIEFGGQNYSVPSRNNKADTSGFNAIPLVGEKAQHLEKFNMAGELHLTPIDLPAISLDFSSKVNLNRVKTFPTSSTGFIQYAYTPDQWTVGATLRSKIVTDLVTRAAAPVIRKMIPTNKRPVLRLQPFVGYFDDTSVYHYTATWQKTAGGDPLSESDAKPNYAYLGTGMELGEIALGKYFKVSNTRLEQDWGMNYAAPQGVTIRGKDYTMEDIRRCGVQGILDAKPTSPCAPTPDQGPNEVRYHYATQRQSRRQFLTTLTFSVGPENRKETISLDIKANRWGRGPNGFMPLDPRHSAEFILKYSFPIGAGITIGPYYRYLTVTAEKSESNFISRKYGFTLTIPLTAKGGHGRFFF
jgi:hypothetical protein